MDGRVPACPRGGLLELAGDPDEQVFPAVGGDQLHAGRQARGRLVQRQAVSCLFEGAVESQEGSRVRSVGRLIQRDRVTVEAAGEFAKFDRAAILRMAARAQPAPGSAGG